MIHANFFQNLKLHGGFIIVGIEFTAEPLVDALEREAIAKTKIVGKKFELLVQNALSQEELSITLYHEVLEAATMPCFDPPDSVIEFNEGDFEREAHAMHAKLGEASPENLNRMLQSFGFRGE